MDGCVCCVQGANAATAWRGCALPPAAGLPAAAACPPGQLLIRPPLCPAAPASLLHADKKQVAPKVPARVELFVLPQIPVVQMVQVSPEPYNE